MKCIVVASAKGGVAKTTTAANLAAVLGEHESTLLVDFDSQGQCSLWFGLDQRGGVYDWLVEQRSLEQATMAGRADSHLWLLPGDSRTKAVERLYHDAQQPQMAELVARLRGLEDHFSYVVVDTAPAGVLQEVALTVADEIVVPFRCEAPGVDGAYGTLAMIERLTTHARLTLLPIDFYAAVVEQRRNLLEFGEAVGLERVARPVPHRIAVAEAVAEGKTVWEYNGRGIGEVRIAYRDLLFRLLEGAAVPWLAAAIVGKALADAEVDHG